jgi:hypothetical protein
LSPYEAILSALQLATVTVSFDTSWACNIVSVVIDRQVTVHVSGVVCADLVIDRCPPALAEALARHRPAAGVTRATPASPLQSTLEDPDSSSMAGRRASGFLQVSLSKVTRHLCWHPPEHIAPSHFRWTLATFRKQ